jgi:hypothetical protein
MDRPSKDMPRYIFILSLNKNKLSFRALAAKAIKLPMAWEVGKN